MPLTSEYLKQIEQALAAGRATEHTYRAALQSFIQSFGNGIVATNEPKRVACGAPDLLITRGETPLGYIETKDIGTPLDKEEKSDQMRRYLEGLGNLVLTDYVEFRWYVDGKYRMTARLASKTRAGKLRVEADGAEHVENLLSAFLEAQAATVGSAKELAVRMARIARLIRGNIRRALAEENINDGKPDPLHDQLASFRQVLLHDLNEEQFADMYAQTICYGLFAARCNAHNAASFTRDAAARLVPKTNPFLQKTFYQMVGPDLSPHVAWAVDDLVALLTHTDMAGILEDFGKRTRREDPVVHFYETFLAEYDQKLKETRGVYYTPEPVVSYIVRSVDHILKNDFKLAGGLADASKIRVPKGDADGETETHRVLILDPATGTGTFLFGAINLIHQTVGAGAIGAWPAYVVQELLPRLFGFELLMAPYTVAHLKLGLLLQETGVDLEQLGAQTDGEAARLHVYLTNTLEEPHEVSTLPLFGHWLAEEAKAASRIKRELPIMVVLGNPPYSRAGYNKGEWIESIMEDYKTTVRQEESQIQSLSNDYIKFIRFSQWRIDRTGSGILAFITGHGYVNGPQARDMRRSLLLSFDRIFILNLHGSVRRTVIETDRDDPVFSIQQGTAIIIAIKGCEKAQGVHYAELIGSLQKKFDYLTSSNITTTNWTFVPAEAPNYFFVPHSQGALNIEDEYKSFHPLPHIFGTGNPQEDKEKAWATGFASQQDEFAISFNDEEVTSKIQKLIDSRNVKELREDFRLCTTNQWNYTRAKDVLKNGSWRTQLDYCAYRPFDFRRTVFNRNVVTILRSTVMRQLRDSFNLALVASRVVNDASFAHIFVSTRPVDKIFLSNKTSTNAYIFPLYLYSSPSGNLLFEEEESTPSGRRPNLSEKFIADFAARLKMRFVADGKGDRKKTFGPEDVFSYMYAVFHSPMYRTRYAEFLKIDFPRLPLTSQPELFRALCRIGDELVVLHLLEKLPASPATFPEVGTNEVEQLRYTAAGEAGGSEGRVWINREQFFAGVTEEVWNFHVGGYQVASKWLKDRKGRKLTFDDINHYRQIIAALAETIRLMPEIDAVIEKHGGWPLK